MSKEPRRWAEVENFVKRALLELISRGSKQLREDADEFPAEMSETIAGEIGDISVPTGDEIAMVLRYGITLSEDDINGPLRNGVLDVATVLITEE